VKLAKNLGVRVIPEIDAPSHGAMKFSSPAIEAIHGNLVKCTAVEYNKPPYWADPPSGTWNITNPNVTSLLT